jgi:hypothetical protein
MVFNLSFTQEELQTILNSLGNIAYVQANPVIETIRKQLTLKKEGSTGEKSVKEEVKTKKKVKETETV